MVTRPLLVPMPGQPTGSTSSFRDAKQGKADLKHIHLVPLVDLARIFNSSLKTAQYDTSRAHYLRYPAINAVQLRLAHVCPMEVN